MASSTAAPVAKSRLESKSFRVIEFVPFPTPDVLPSDWTKDNFEERLDRHARSRLATMGMRAGYPIDQDTFGRTKDVKGNAVRDDDDQVRDVRPSDWGADMRHVEWQATGNRLAAASATNVSAVHMDDGSWVAALPHEMGGIIAIKHGLDSESVAAQTFRKDGTPIGHVEVIPISPTDVEVVAVWGTARIALTKVELEDAPSVV